MVDLLLTRDHSRAHIIDFNPYAPRTDPLLFDYDELYELLQSHEDGAAATKPEFRVIDSRAHADANLNAPAYQHNMVPIEALQLSSGRSTQEFAEMWEGTIRESMGDE